MMHSPQAPVAGWGCSSCGYFVPADTSHTCPTVPYEPGIVPATGWMAITATLKEHREFALKDALSAFEQRLADHQVVMPPEFIELVSKHFWDLV